MPRSASYIVALVVICVLGASCTADDPTVASPSPTFVGSPSSVLTVSTANGREANLSVAIADDDAERATGLMGVPELPSDQGMAFLWDAPTFTTFWMKNTLIPLSIAFWDAEGRVVAILDMQPCAKEPCPTYGPGVPFVGAVEANLGWFDDHGVTAGDHVELEVRDDA